jgi:serralysin
LVLPVYTNDQIATYLKTGFAADQGYTQTHWNVSTGGTLSVNISNLAATGQFFALAALKTWSEITGILFAVTTAVAQITFYDDGVGSAYEEDWSVNGWTTQADIHISQDWTPAGDIGNLNSYTLQTYLHEIGHALGLGHAGNYNGSAIYDQNLGTAGHNKFLNDSWQASVMSYFSQSENSYISPNASYAYVLTPMVADILAVQTFYGTNTNAHTGNTVYGFNATAGNAVFDATQIAAGSYTIMDSTGIDTMDYSGYSQNQVISLIAETYSDIGGKKGNVTIARGTIIENAIGGSGNDTLTGNAVANVLQGGGGSDALNGGGGNDTASYAGSTAGVTVSLLVAGTQVSAGDASGDTLNSIENLTGSSQVDTLTGDGNANILNGGLGNDTLIGGAGADQLIGGGGSDTASYATSATGVTVNLATPGAQTSAGDASGDTLSGIANLIGSAAIDTLTGDGSANTLNGGGGNDFLNGAAGSDLLTGGTANDSFVFNIADLAVGQADTITDFIHDATGAGDTIRLIGVNAANVNVTASGANAVVGYGNGAITDTITAQSAGTNPFYVFGYASVANAQSGNLANGFTFVSDAMNQAANLWSKYIQYFDGAGVLDYQNTSYDNGTRAFLNLDNIGNESWVNYTDNYSAANALMNRITVYDDNSQYRTYLDYQVNQTWSQYVESFDAQGRLDYRVTTNDDGSLYVTHLDRLNNQTWSQYVETFDPQGRLDYRVTTNDNGSLYVTHNDHNNNQVWSTYIDIYDTQGRNTFEQFNYDNGTRDDITIDALNQQTWARDVYVYSPTNVLTQHYWVMDDGSIVLL